MIGWLWRALVISLYVLSHPHESLRSMREVFRKYRKDGE